MPAVLLCQQGTEYVIITHFYLFLEQEMVRKYNRGVLPIGNGARILPILFFGYTVKKSHQRLSCALISLSAILELIDSSALCDTSCSLVV